MASNERMKTCFYKWAIHDIFFFYLRLFYKQLTVNMFNKSCRWLDSNQSPLVSEATALPSMPQPHPTATANEDLFASSVTGKKSSNVYKSCAK